MITTPGFRRAALTVVIAAAAIAAVAGPGATAASARHGGRPRPTSTTTRPPAGLVTPTAPSNLRVTGTTATSVTVQWDHSEGVNAPPGCTLALTMYYVFVDGRYYGATYLGSPVALVRVTPGVTTRITVQGRDNCTGLLSPMSEPLVYHAPVRI